MKFALWFAEVDKSDDGTISRSELFDHLLVEIDQQLGGVINIKNLELRESMKHQGTMLATVHTVVADRISSDNLGIPSRGHFDSFIKSRESCQKGGSKSRQRWR